MNCALKIFSKSPTNILNIPIRLTKRCYATPPKRFYKSTSVVYNDGNYEVTLDSRKLKTPKGTLFTVKSEPLAIAVATEFGNQREYIERSTMYLSALCFTAIDNPNNQTKADMINHLLNFLPTDTVLYQCEDEKDLSELQFNEWNPIIDWFNKRYETNLRKTPDLTPPHITEEDKSKMCKHFLSYDEEVLHGFIFAVDTLKSVLLACAAIDRHISVEKAVYLSRLEEEYQQKFWGRVEWAHEVNQHDLQARLAAAILFIHLNTSEHFIKEKIII